MTPSVVAVLPCPFCGNAPVLDGSEAEATCGCDSCGAPFFSGYADDFFATFDGSSQDAFSMAAARWNNWATSVQKEENLNVF